MEGLQRVKKASTARYENLKFIIDKYKPKTICEVGTEHGNGSVFMINEALKHHDEIHFTGYDLFEGQTKEMNIKEKNGKGTTGSKVKPVPSLSALTNKLNKIKSSNPNFDFNLIKGNTNETLKEDSFDLVFIDGGHSPETVENDYLKLKGSKVIVFDDYLLPERWWGANSVVEKYKLDIEFCPNYFYIDGTIKKGMAKKSTYQVYITNGVDSK